MVSLRSIHRLLLAVSILAILAGLTGIVAAQERDRHVLALEVDGIISPVVERFIGRAVERAEEREAELLVIRLDTPGGLLSSTRKIVEHLLNAEVPIAVYVAPRGAFAASAGTFITAAANFAAMAPGTNIGAASPVGGSGEDLEETLRDKVTNDAAALMRSIADERGRNAEKLEETVLRASSYSAEEAVKLNVVDLIAGDQDDLLAQLHGREVTTPAGVVVLNTRDVEVRDFNMSLVERFLAFLSDPNVSFLLLSLGSLGILVELLNPGLVAPGVVGAILLILAFVAFGNLPVNWAGVTLILLAVGLTVLEVYVAGFGILGVGAIISFVLGGLLLFFQTGIPSPTMPRVGVSLWVLVSTSVVLGGGGAWALAIIIRSRRGQPDQGVAGLVGKMAEVTTDLAPRGTVRLENQLWTAVAEGTDQIVVGEGVEVVKVDGIILTVARPSDSQLPMPEAPAQ